MQYHVLLVDDEPMVTQTLKRVLQRHYDIDTATNGANALKLLQENEYAAIIADMKMPGMDGVELLSRARKIAPDTVRIMLSGNRDFDTSIRAVNEGAIYRFLTKPFPAKAMLLVLETAVEQYETNRQLTQSAAINEQAEQMLSICSYCKKVREPEKSPDEEMNWERIELFLSRHFGFRFSHCVCPECVDRLYHELEEMKLKALDNIAVGAPEEE